MYRLLKTDGRAKRGELQTVHGTIQTPVFMNVGTVAAIKGAVSTMDLKEIGTQVELSNTYHLHVRTGDKLIKEMGGLQNKIQYHNQSGDDDSHSATPVVSGSVVSGSVWSVGSAASGFACVFVFAVLLPLCFAPLSRTRTVSRCFRST